MAGVEEVAARVPAVASYRARRRERSDEGTRRLRRCPRARRRRSGCQSQYEPAGDQPKAIQELVDGLKRGDEAQVLLGITGSGKTFTIANVIAEIERPTLIIAHNKTLAAQLYGEFKELFPDNAVHYFVSYYDYYQPEAYVPTTDTFIEKDSIVNEEIDRMRHAATFALLSRRDVIIVASVSCIYGIGARETYATMTCELDVGDVRSIATACCAGSSSCSTSATTSTSTAARSACAATPSRCSRRTRPTPRSASSCSAIRSRR